MIFHPTQGEVAQDTTQFRVVCCGRQWGKTTLAVWEMLGCAYAKKGRRVGYFATTFTQARDIAWKQLKEICAPVLAKEPNETRLEITIKTQDGGTSEIVLRGFEAVETARGTQFDLLVLDEVAKMRNFTEGWQGALTGTLAFRNGCALFISTPYGFNHFYDLYELGQGKNPLYKSWKFTSFDNSHLSVEYLAGIQASSTPDYWAQEYLADFRRFTGLIYKEFDLVKHVHDFDHTFNDHADYYIGQDFAVRGFTACVVAKIKPDGHIYIIDVYKEDNKTATQHIEAEVSMLKTYANFDKFTGYADPAGFAKNQQKGEMLWSLADEYIEAGFALNRANNDVRAGINYVQQLFMQDKIHIHPRCIKLIEELLQYQWEEQTAHAVGNLNEQDKPKKFNDHLVDAMRYMLYSKPEKPEEEEAPRLTTFPSKFPEPRIEEPDENEDQLTPIDFDSPFG